MVNLQQSNLQILKNTDCFLCLCVSLINTVLQQVISSKFLLRLTINFLFLTSNVLFFPFFFLSDKNIQQNYINYSIAKMGRNWMLSTQVFINQPFVPPKESLSFMNVVFQVDKDDIHHCRNAELRASSSSKHTQFRPHTYKFPWYFLTQTN